MKAPAPGGDPGRAETSEQHPKSTACTAENPARPAFTLILRPEPGVDGVQAMRAALKRLLRDHGLRCVECKPALATEAEIEAFEDAFERHQQAQEERHATRRAGR